MPWKTSIPSNPSPSTTSRYRNRDEMARSGLRSAAVAFACVGLLMTAAMLSPLRAQTWKELSPKERYDALQNYQQHQQLPEDRQKDVERRYERWRNMPPDARDRV